MTQIKTADTLEVFRQELMRVIRVYLENNKLGPGDAAVVLKTSRAMAANILSGQYPRMVKLSALIRIAELINIPISIEVGAPAPFKREFVDPTPTAEFDLKLELCESLIQVASIVRIGKSEKELGAIFGTWGIHMTEILKKLPPTRDLTHYVNIAHHAGLMLTAVVEDEDGNVASVIDLTTSPHLTRPNMRATLRKFSGKAARHYLDRGISTPRDFLFYSGLATRYIPFVMNDEWHKVPCESVLSGLRSVGYKVSYQIKVKQESQ